VVGLEIKGRENYMLPSRHQNAGQNRDIKVANSSFENVLIQIIREDSKKLKFHSGGNWEEI
jgi:hypothetical protein